MTQPIEEETPIHTLMARDPLKLSDQDIDTLVAELRKRRKAFNQGNKTAGNLKPPSKAAKKKAEAAKVVDASALGNLLDL